MATRTFEPGDVVRVPFPYTDRSTRQRRPALVVSYGATGPEQRLLWVVMITSADNRGWPHDVVVLDEAIETGLPIPSVIRPVKIATVEAAHVDQIGRVSVATARAVEAAIATILKGELP